MANGVISSVKHVRELQERPLHYGWVEGLYLAGNDDGVALRLHAGEDYEPQSRKFWRSLASKARIVIDVGAHTGVYSLDAWASGAREVMSIEPYHMNYARLVMNLRHAGFDTTNCVYCACGNGNGLGQLFVGTPFYYCSAGAMLGGDETNDIARYPVNVRRLDDLVLEKLHCEVDLVKIDTEYHGKRVLSGMTRILQHRPDLLLEVIEPGMGQILKPLGYHFYKIDEKTGFSPVEDLIPDEPYTHDSPNRFATVKAL